MKRQVHPMLRSPHGWRNNLTGKWEVARIRGGQMHRGCIIIVWIDLCGTKRWSWIGELSCGTVAKSEGKFVV